ncbi:MAG TPA: hypothetical protein VGS19_03110 [Streptosporangiaceae bacterium]|nr:hypothetical protein [Streptosporangiaceae bacterium]
MNTAALMASSVMSAPMLTPPCPVAKVLMAEPRPMNAAKAATTIAAASDSHSRARVFRTKAPPWAKR